MSLAPGTIEGFALVLARTSALVLSAPILGVGAGFSGYKIALILTLSFLLYGVAGEPVVDLDAVTLAVCALRELLIGAFLGFLLYLATFAVHVTGQMVGHEMGFMVARQVDPVTGVQIPLITSMYENLFLLALLSLNAHHWLLRSLGESFSFAPVGRMDLGGGVATTAIGMFTEMFRAGIVFAAPVMIFLMLVSVLLGLLARAVPNMNVLEVGFSARVVVASCAMFLFAPLLEPAITSVHEKFVLWLGRGLTALGS